MGGGVLTKYSFLVKTISIISRFAVPIFVMLSGAFLLSNPKNEDAKMFYKKNVNRILIPVLVFSALYFSFRITTSLLSGDNVLIAVKNLLLGEPYYHMWYMYMIIGLYVFVPYIVKNISKLNNCLFICLFIWCALSGATSDIPINYGISKVVTYIGYFLAGYKIREYTLSKKNNFKGILLIFLGFVCEIILSIISFYYGSYLDNLPLLKLIILSSSHFNLFGIMASLLIFTGFSYLNINMNCSKIANKTFLIYLIHPFVLYFIEYIIRTKIGIGINVLIAIPVELILVFVISYLLSNLYSIFMKIINKNNCIGNFIIKILKLDI